jgi:hypothetical protein
MTTILVQAQVSPDELVKGVEQLSQPELEQFVSTVLTLQAQRKAPVLAEDEAELLLKINRGIPPELQQRYAVLIEKRRNEELTAEEYDELLRLTDSVETLETQRIQHLAELAQLRRVSLRQLMLDLGIVPPRYA